MTINEGNGQADLFGPSLAEAKSKLMDEAQVGTHCPCCGKFVKVYHRKFNSGMAVMMCYLYGPFRRSPHEWLDVGHYLISKHHMWPSDYGKLVWWGMLEKNEDAVPINGAKSAGLFRMTEAGRAFAEGKLRVPSHAHEYMSDVQSFDGDPIDIRQALGRKFDYRELMREIGILIDEPA